MHCYSFFIDLLFDCYCRVRKFKFPDGFCAVGKVTSVSRHSSPIELPCADNNQQTPIHKFFRVIVNQSLLYSVEYRRVTVRNTYTIAYHDVDCVMFGLIQYFIHVSGRTGAVLKSLVCTSCSAHFGVAYNALDSLPSSHFMRVVSVGSLTFVPLVNFLSKCVLMEFSHGTYVVSFPNTLTFD